MPKQFINHANFYYELHGQGHPIILIAGYTCDHLIWTPILEALSKHFQVCIFDNRGVGQTQDDNGPLSAKLMAQDVMLLAEQLQLKKPHIIGQSMGGTIAQMVGSLYADKIGKLCIMNSSAKWRKAMIMGERSLLMMREKGLDFDFIFAATLPWIFGNAFLEDEQALAQLKKNLLENPFPQSLTDQQRQFTVLDDFDGIPFLKDIKADTLVVAGLQDLISLPGESRYLADHIKHAKLSEFDSGHGIMNEVPRELAQALITFLNG